MTNPLLSSNYSALSNFVNFQNMNNAHLIWRRKKLHGRGPFQFVQFWNIEQKCTNCSTLLQVIQCNNMPKLYKPYITHLCDWLTEYMAKLCKFWNFMKYFVKLSKFVKVVQICANLCKFVQICAKFCKVVQSCAKLSCAKLCKVQLCKVVQSFAKLCIGLQSTHSSI